MNSKHTHVRARSTCNVMGMRGGEFRKYLD